MVSLAATVLVAGLTACSSTNSATPAASSGSSASSAPATSASAASSTAGSKRTATSAASGASELDGVTVIATEVSGAYTIVPGSTISLTFKDGRVAAQAGCNNISGAYTVKGDVLSVTPQMVSTMMACEPALMDQDTWLSAFLSSSPTWTYTDGTLTLTNGTDTIVAGKAPSGAAALENTGWKVVGLIANTSSANSVSAVDPAVIAWLRFADGQVAVNTGCNTGGGSAQITDSTIIFGAIAMSMRACIGPTEAVEQTMTAVLQGTTSYQLSNDPSGGLLTITSADGASGLQLTADPSLGSDAFAGGPSAASSTAASTG
ncbi:MAG: META domain-containing protein [Nakamurella sp.]